MMTHELWYAVKVSCRSERKIAAMLVSKGYEPFLPTYKAKRRRSNQVETLELPLFPGYLLCRFDVQKRLPTLTTPGVGYVVGIGRVPEPIDEAEIDAIRTVVESGAVYEPYPYVSVGQRVRIECGPLYGLTGFVTEFRSNFRLIVSVNLLMRSVSVEIDRAWITPVNEPSKEYSHPTGMMLDRDTVRTSGLRF